jgi:hypothetical protein
MPAANAAFGGDDDFLARTRNRRQTFGENFFAGSAAVNISVIV